LIVEDNSGSSSLLEATLERYGYQVVAACDHGDAARLLGAADAPRMAVLDATHQESSVAELCRRIRAESERPYTYVVLLVDRDGPRKIAESADDYLSKPFAARELQLLLHSGRRFVEQQDELAAARRSLKEQATHDGLTGTWNRSAILDMLQRELDRSSRQGFSDGVILVDVDRLKEVNHRLGYLAGDSVLREVGARMLGCLRPYDAIGRYDGGQFLVLLPECDRSMIAALAERLREAVSQKPIGMSGGAVTATVTLGVTSTSDGAIVDPAVLLRAAEEALQRAKSAGRNRVELTPPWSLTPANGQVTATGEMLEGH
jgi:diguanylate cyclase (GGDEF)-like protein